MSEAAFFGAPARVRALSFATSAVLVAATCLVLVLLSRVTAYLDDPIVAGVEVEIAPREETRAAPRTPPAQRATDAAAPPTLTPLPVEREILARALDCYDTLNGEERPADCPRFSDEALAQAPAGVFGQRAPRAPMQAFTRAEQAALFAGVDPPCAPGFSTGTRLAASVCIRFGIRPPPPSRSAEEICLAGGIGPCTPPPFRPEDVVRLPHTQ